MYQESFLQKVERRKSYRVQMTFPVELFSSTIAQQVSSEGETIDISEGGAKIKTQGSISHSGTVDIYFKLPPCYSSDPEKATGIKTSGRIIWSKPIHNNKWVSGIEILAINRGDLSILRNIINSGMRGFKKKREVLKNPKLKIRREMHSCNMYSVDLTIGCEHSCLYCHFSELQIKKYKQKNFQNEKFPIPVDISSIYKMRRFPKTVIYLSPSSDPFAPLAKDLTHELLSFMLPKGAIFTISTKGIIPKKTIRLFKKYHHLIEGIAVCVTNLDEKRNKILEPYAPLAEERVEHIKELSTIGWQIGIRMDPIFPLIDDSEENFHQIISRGVKNGIRGLSGTFIFTFGNFFKRLNEISELKESMQLITEKTFPLGGKAFSVSLNYRKQKYNRLNELCKKYGIKFRTCGCKQIQLEREDYPLICRNLDYYKGRE